VSGANTYSGGTVVNSGTLQLGASAALPSAQAVTVAGGTLDIHGYNPNAGAVTLTSGTISGTGALTGTSFAVQSGTISSVLAGSGALTKSTAGTLTLSGANTYTGGTTIDNGTLALSGSGMLGSGGININSLATLDASAQAGGFALTGGQSLTNRGTFIGGLIIQSGANVSGGGSFNGAVTNLFGGTLTPGIGGDTNFFQSLTLADGSTNSFWIGNSAHDMSVVSNSLTVTGTGIPELKLDLSGYTWNRDDQFVIYDNLFSGYSSLNGTNSFFQFRDAFGVVSNLYNNALFSAITGTGGSSATNLFRINYDVLANGDGQYNDIAITAIPEPASLNLLVMLGAAYWMRRRLHSQRRRWGL
ncbi:MAG: autotransporter-associated beta strand repeat-containing protein, partial [Kiritimatiellaeota bacterium]|nr:autotransporter-associated beta strand repeat-containing protein [Kiritimatiellota bacterium]